MGKILCSEGGEPLSVEAVVLHPWRCQGQVGWGTEQLSWREDGAALPMAGDWNWVTFDPNHSVIL